MAFLQETNKWTPSIYRIERNDPLMGGEFGINNVQARQLASRTQYLLEYFLRFHEVDGRHKLTESSIADNAAIPENCLALQVPTATLGKQYRSSQDEFDSVLKALYSVSSMSGTAATALYKALLLSWEYSGASYDFCLFSNMFPFCDHTLRVPVVKTVASDDSIDIVDEAAQGLLKEGESYILVCDDALPKIVTVDRILDLRRVVLKEDLNITLGEDKNAYLCQCSWDILEFKAHVKPGGMMLTRLLENLKEYSVGMLSIQHHTHGTPFLVQYRYSIDEEWQNATAQGCSPIADGLFRTRFSFPAGAPVYLKIEAQGTDVIENMATYADVEYDNLSFVRTPMVSGPFKIQRFGALYNDQFAALEVTISDSINFDTPQPNTRTLRFTPDTLEMTEPEIDLYSSIDNYYSIVSGRTYYWYAKYYSQRGYVSNPSKVLTVVA